jgi:threonine aldolase
MASIDLRSDTVTLPSAAMREAIFSAEVGDDVFGEDPTVNRLEKMAAERMGKEGGLFVASGTMANSVCVLTHCRRGEEVILGDKSHTFVNEAGAMSALGGIHPHTVANQPDGTMRPEDIEAAIRGSSVHFPRTQLICLENTHNMCSGAALSAEYTESVVELAKRHGLLVHLDGARIFNAAIALGVDAEELTRGVDSVAFCFSKGLSAPVGSVVCGSGDFIAEARRTRKLLGGGMRQAGVIAAAGIVALEEMVERLAEDHVNARRLAEGISQIDGLSIDVGAVQTNIIYFDLVSGRVSAEEFLRRLEQKGIKLLRTGGPARFRMVTHYGIGAEDIEVALAGLREVMEES